ncbi:hypothetical protein SUGI_0978530 [Cryptomeria japonica]|nr:hypothetical protein SUGI_0978530 [Cryptomeria japonica]
MLGTFIGVDGNYQTSTEVKLLIDMDINKRCPEPLELTKSIEAYNIWANFYEGSLPMNVMTHNPFNNSPQINSPSQEKNINFSFRQGLGGFYLEYVESIITEIVDNSSLVKPLVEEITKSPIMPQPNTFPSSSPILEQDGPKDIQLDDQCALEEGEFNVSEEEQIPCELEETYNRMGFNQLFDEDE